MSETAPAKPRAHPTRENTPVGGTRHASNQHAALASSSTATLLDTLYAKSLVPQGGEATVENLANALLLLSKQKDCSKNTSLVIILKAIAVLLKVATDPYERLEQVLETAVESRVGSAVKRLEVNVTKLTEEISEFKAELSKTSNESAEKAVVAQGRAGFQRIEWGSGGGGDSRNEAVGQARMEGEGTGRSYARAAGGQLEKPTQVVTSRLEKQDRQILIDCEAVEVEGIQINKLPESSLVLQANMAIEKLSAEMLQSRPEGARFRSANVLQNGGVVYEMNSKEAADWIKRPDICAAFADGFGPTVTIKERNFPVVIECVPVSFDTSQKSSFGRLELDNNLPADSIASGRYIRPPAKRSQGQRHAHVVLQFKTKDAANLCIKSPMIVEGKQSDARKLAKKPVRCTKCQKFGHATLKCRNPINECGTCSGQHDTKDCKNRNNTYCKTCKMPGHPTWDTKCPGYYAECQSFATRVPDNLYKYYLTNEDWTWEKVTDAKPSITTAPPFQPTAQAFALPPRPRFIQPPPFGRYVHPNAPTVTNSNSIPIPENARRQGPSTPAVPPPQGPTEWGAIPTSPNPESDNLPSLQDWSPSVPHPRPDNVARPISGGATLTPRASKPKSIRRTKAATAATPATGQGRLSNYFGSRRGSVSSTYESNSDLNV